MNPTTRLVVLGVMAVLVAGMWVATFLSKRMERVTEGIEPFDARSFESLTVVTLGTGETFENHWRHGPAVALGRGTDLLVVDAGRGVAEGLRAARIPAEQPQAVLLSSLRPENTVGLDDLWITGWLRQREAPLRVIGPRGTAALVEGLRQAHQAGTQAEASEWSLPEGGLEVQVTELAGGESLAVGALSVRTALLPDGPLPTLAYRISADDQAAVLGGAGHGVEAWLSVAQDAGIWVAGAVYGASLDAAAEAEVPGIETLRREARSRLRLEDVGELATRAGVRAIILTRLRPPPAFDFVYERVVGPNFRGPVFVAEDGDEFTP